MNGDILCDLDYSDFYQHHVKRQHEVTVSVYSRTTTIDFGVVKYDSNNIATEFVEKPAYHFEVSMGVYCLNRSVIDRLPKGNLRI